MKREPTAGPWTINESGKSPIIGYDCKDGGPLLPIVDTVHGYDMEQAEANTRLIAAAPGMREALQVIANMQVYLQPTCPFKEDGKELAMRLRDVVDIAVQCLKQIEEEP